MEERRTQPAGGGKNMSLLAHLAELRSRLFKSLAALAVGCALAWNFAPQVLHWLLAPLTALLPPGQSLIFTGLQDAFMVTLKISLWSGFFISAPVWLYQLWAFVAPALYPVERKGVGRLAALATLLLGAGLAFAYFAVFPLTFQFFLRFSGDTLMAMPTVDRYLSLCMGLILAFALAFQLPLALMFLGRLGLVSDSFLRKNRPYAIIVIFIVGAVLTPPDVVSQLLLAGALLLLYELSIFLVARQQKAASE